MKNPSYWHATSLLTWQVQVDFAAGPGGRVRENISRSFTHLDGRTGQIWLLAKLHATDRAAPGPRNR